MSTNNSTATTAKNESRKTLYEQQQEFKKLNLFRLVINSIAIFVILTATLLTSIGQNLLVKIWPSTYDGFVKSAEILLAHPNSRDLPNGFWVDEERSTERILFIKAWTGEWKSYSRSSSTPWSELDSGNGFSGIALPVIVSILSFALGTIVTKNVPLKHSLVWRYIW